MEEKLLNFFFVRYLSSSRIAEKRKSEKHSPTVDIYSDSDDDDIIPATPDIATDSSGDDAQMTTKRIESKNIENKIADRKISEKSSATSREQMLTGSEWLKLIESRRGKNYTTVQSGSECSKCQKSKLLKSKLL